MTITIYELSNHEVATALELTWEVFTEFEAPDYSQEGVEEFRGFIDNQDEIKKLRFFGAFFQDKMVGILAMRQEHICLLFADRRFCKQVLSATQQGKESII